MVWDRNRKNDAKFFSVGHEYMLVYAKDKQHLIDSRIIFREPKEGLEQAKSLFSQLRKKHKDDWTCIQEEWRNYFKNLPNSDPRKKLGRYSKVGKRGPYRDDGNINWPGGGGPRYEILHPVTKKPVKQPNSGWRFPTAERFWEEYESGKILFGEDETKIPTTISYLFENNEQVMQSVFYSYAQTASQEFDAIFQEKRVFDNPKNWRDLFRLFRYFSTKGNIIFDFFAGSGTTAHAVMNLNREDNGKRKYILVEMGEHFNSVLLPRIKKLAFSDSWKEGNANGGKGISHFVKYYELEQYEDVLNRARYADADLFNNPYEDPYHRYVFLRDAKLLDSIEINTEQNKVHFHPARLYPDIDLAETLSQRRGKWIKRITAEYVEFQDGETVSLTDPDWQVIKPLVWWQ